MLTRRLFLSSLAAVPLAPSLAAATGTRVLTARTGRQQIAPEGFPETEIWGFDGTLPGPVLRARQGGRLRVEVVNDLAQPTSVHWHGIRIENAMDGVPGLTQPPIAPGGRFVYDFALPDAGTYWYHSHVQSTEQVERGLQGALIVEEAGGGPDVDHDLVLVLDDVRLERDGTFAPFGNRHDASHAGRIGNLWLANGAMDPRFAVRRGDRLRLRLINSANARVFELGLKGLEGWTVALDGMPLAAPERVGERLVLGPAQRADLIVDVMADGPEAFLVTYERDGGYAIATFDVAEGTAPRSVAPAPLPANPDFPIVLEGARTATLLMEGGAMRGLSGAVWQGEARDMRELAQAGLFWALNGTVGRPDVPLIEARRGETVRIALGNDTAFAHAMHLHGMHFAEVLRDGTLGPLRDTLLVAPGELREVAFNAHNPGDWLLHCHMLGHHQAGMGTWVRVAA